VFGIARKPELRAVFPRIISRIRCATASSSHSRLAARWPGIMARTDASRGVWKAPAGIEATLSGRIRLTVT